MAFSEKIKNEAMVSCGRRCCICHKFCGNNMEIHHIKAKGDGGEDTFENAIPLCFDCHAIVRQYDPKHPKGTRFTETELKMHRDAWYQKMNRPEEKESESEPLKFHHQKGYQNIMLMKMDSGNEIIDSVAIAQGITFSQEAETIEEVEIISEFVQYIKELMDYDLLDEPSDKIMATFNLSEEIKKLEEAGFWVFANIEEQKLTGGIKKNAEVFHVLILRIVKKNSKDIIKVDMSIKE